MMVHPRCDFVEQKVGVDGGGSGGNGASGTACEACKRISNAILSGYQAMQENQKFLGSMTEPPRGYLAQAVPYEIGAVLAALRRYSSPVVVVAACRWLGKAAFYDNYQGAGDDIQQMGAHAAVVAALARHGESVSVLTNACLAIAHMCGKGKTRLPSTLGILEDGTLHWRQESLVIVGSVETLLTTLARHPTVASLQEQAVRYAFINMLLYKVYPGNSNRLPTTVICLGNARPIQPSYRQLITDNGGVELLVKVLTSCPEEAPTTRLLYALANLADPEDRHFAINNFTESERKQYVHVSGEIKNAIRDAGGLEAIISAISRHEQLWFTANAQGLWKGMRGPFHALRAIRYLSQDNVTNQHVLEQLGAFDKIIFIMTTIMQNFKTSWAKTGRPILNTAGRCYGQGKKGPNLDTFARAIQVEAISAMLSMVKSNVAARTLLLTNGGIRSAVTAFNEFRYTSDQNVVHSIMESYIRYLTLPHTTQFIASCLATTGILTTSWKTLNATVRSLRRFFVTSSKK